MLVRASGRESLVTPFDGSRQRLVRRLLRAIGHTVTQPVYDKLEHPADVLSPLDAVG